VSKAPKGIVATESDVGRKVIYRTAPNYEPEEGVITSIGRIGNVFVRYGSQCTSQSTDMSDLDWVMP
jgi:hypothetical protein